ncbi:MAG TPA: GIY-YIG nuclease family protein [Nitrospira sp.]|nr:GIY-YIG nuclease family protein [Nitrospira sp.]
MYYVYILHCSDYSFYVGSTRNVENRVHAHNSGRGATYTFKRRPVRLVYEEAFQTEAEAIKRERQLKRWSAVKKQSLIDGNIERLRCLSKRRA